MVEYNDKPLDESWTAYVQKIKGNPILYFVKDDGREPVIEVLLGHCDDLNVCNRTNRKLSDVYGSFLVFPLSYKVNEEGLKEIYIEIVRAQYGIRPSPDSLVVKAIDKGVVYEIKQKNDEWGIVMRLIVVTAPQQYRIRCNLPPSSLPTAQPPLAQYQQI